MTSITLNQSPGTLYNFTGEDPNSGHIFSGSFFLAGKEDTPVEAFAQANDMLENWLERMKITSAPQTANEVEAEKKAEEVRKKHFQDLLARSENKLNFLDKKMDVMSPKEDIRV